MSEELVFEHYEFSRVLSLGFFHHNVRIYFLTFAKHALDKIYFFFSDFQFELFFQHFNHALLKQIYLRFAISEKIRLLT